jgi:hypothetical protein
MGRQRFKRICAVLLLPALIGAQALPAAYYEASGQTKPFILAAGARADWDNSGMTNISARKNVPSMRMMNIFPNPSSGNLKVSIRKTVGTALVTILDVSGKKIHSAVLSQDRNELTLPKHMSNGVYVASLHMNGRVLQKTRFLVMR